MALHVLDEANRCLGCKKPLCQQGCPIHTNIPEVIRLLKANQMDEAGRMLFENNPLTTVCALVCNHENQCEGHCVRNRMPSHDPVHFSIIEDYISTTSLLSKKLRYFSRSSFKPVHCIDLSLTGCR